MCVTFFYFSYSILFCIFDNIAVINDRWTRLKRHLHLSDFQLPNTAMYHINKHTYTDTRPIYAQARTHHNTYTHNNMHSHTKYIAEVCICIHMLCKYTLINARRYVRTHTYPPKHGVYVYPLQTYP